MKIRPFYLRSGLKVGDTVRVVGMPEGLRDTKDFKTLTLFRLCQLETFRIFMFDDYNNAGIEIRKRKPQFKKFKGHWIFVETYLLRRVRRAKVKSRREK
jgi:hypothetical protein